MLKARKALPAEYQLPKSLSEINEKAIELAENKSLKKDDRDQKIIDYNVCVLEKIVEDHPDDQARERAIKTIANLREHQPNAKTSKTDSRRDRASKRSKFSIMETTEKRR